MTKVIATIASFTSFEEIAEVLARWGEEIPIPENPLPGIHVVSIYDDGGERAPQHALVVVIGGVEQKWRLQEKNFAGDSPIGKKFFTVEFEEGEIPLFINSEEVRGQISMHSLWGPSCRCFSFIKDQSEKRSFEIAMEILAWRFRQMGSEKFMGELKAVVEDTKISDGEMLEFFKILSADMMKEKK